MFEGKAVSCVARLDHWQLLLLLLLLDTLALSCQQIAAPPRPSPCELKKLMSLFHLFVRQEVRTILKWLLGKSKDSGKSTGTLGLLL